MADVADPAVASISLTQYNSEVYEPSDDSFLLVDALVAAQGILKALQPKRCVEIGCGSGYVVCSLALLLRQLGIKSQLLATDVSPQAANAAEATLRAHGVVNVDVVLTDLVEALTPNLNGTVDLLVFNPPYVPTPDEEVERPGIARAWAGGHRGRRVIDRVLSQLGTLLSPTGHLLMIAVLENEPQGIIQEMEAAGFQGEVLLSRGADEELLHVVHLWRQ